MASNHHAQPLPPSGHIHHQYASHPQPPPQRPAYSSHPSSSHPPANRHLPPLASQSQSPPYPHRQDSSLPSLSPYNQRPPYPPSTSFPPPLSRQQSQHQAPPPQSYHHQQPPQPGHYPPPPPSSHGHGHWDSPQNGRHDPPPPPQHPAHPSHPGHQRSDSSSSKLNGVPPTRRPSVSERESTGAPEPPPIAAVPREAEESGPPASDFVKKLAKMLDDPNYASVVSWGPKGDCFVVRDMTEFTKSILPRMFKHSNFASFVRQLNKYDFHKIKNSDEYGDQCWTFHHPDFQRSNRDALENIKRKVPAQRKTGRGSTAAGPPLPGSPSDAPAGGLASVETGAVSSMQAQIDALSRSNDDLVASIAALERNYQNVLNEMVVYQRGMAAQDSLMQNLISYFIQLENGKSPNDGLGKVIETYGGERPSFPHLNGMAGMSYSGSAASVDSNATTLVSGSSPDLSPMERSVLARQESMQRLEELKRSREARNAAAAAVEIPPNAPTPGTAPFITSLNPAAAVAAAAAGLAQAIPATAGSAPTRVFGQARAEEEAAAAAAHAAVTSAQAVQAVQAAQVAQVQAVQAAQAAQVAQAQAAAISAPPPSATAPVAAGPPPPPEWTYPGGQEARIQEVPSEPSSSTFIPAPTAGPSLEITTMDNTELLESPGGSRLRLRKGAFSPAWAVPPRVLLVDDDQVSRKLFSKFLQVSGCTIDVAVDGIGAVNKMNLEKYDLVLMDIVMPKLDGVSATSLIRQFDHMTPIISMTSNNKPNDVVTYYSSGMNDILPKPFTRESLFTMLEKHLMHLKAITMARPPMEDPGRMIAPTDEQYSSMLNLLGMGGDPMSGFPSMDPGAGLTMAEPAASVKRALEVDDDRDTKRPRFELVE